jgi:hypothetical protein
MAFILQDFLTAITSTGIVVAGVVFICREAIKHWFAADLATFKSNLKNEGDLTLARKKAEFDQNLTEFQSILKRNSDAELARLQTRIDREMAQFQSEMGERNAHADRIRQEVVRWSNPILGAVEALRSRLKNIVLNDGWKALSRENATSIDPDWAITHDYFLESTVYLFCQYFCWVRLLQESLSFEFFRNHADKDSFFEKVRAVSEDLSNFPLPNPGAAAPGGDYQVFNLQQRGLGEALIVGQPDKPDCMRYAEFLRKWSDVGFARQMAPMTSFVEGLNKNRARRWERLVRMMNHLEALGQECQRLLNLPTPR